MKKTNILKSLYAFIILSVACSPSYYKYIGTATIKENTTEIDYSNLKNWASHPRKKDPADSIPLPLQKEPRDSSVDVFFLHPTTFTDMKKVNEKNAFIDNDTINTKTDYTTILYQASVFNESCRIYAPRYRQAHIGMFNYSDTMAARKAFSLAYEDIKHAFEYYMKYENHGRPIIIASHSQGTLHARRLLKEYFDHQNNQLVVAYLLGLYVDAQDYKNIPVCTDSTKTGCLISWRTYKKNYEGPEYIKNENKAVVINPLSWTNDSLEYSKINHHGAILFNMNKIIPNVLSAQIHKNLLWVTKPKFPGSILYISKNYHAGDINLYYVNIREDIKRRIKYYYKNQN